MNYLIIFILCVIIQKYFKQKSNFNSEQYFYLRDLSLLIILILLALWTNSYKIQSVITCAFLSFIATSIQKTFNKNYLKLLIIIPALIFAFTGNSINFLIIPFNQNYLYLNYWQSILLTSFWIILFNFLYRRLDNISGLAGHLLITNLSLIIAITLATKQALLSEAFILSLIALLIALAYWSRICNNFRQLGSPLASFWGTLIAGISIISLSKTISITTLITIPLGFYAVPLLELAIFFINKKPVKNLYSHIIEQGVDHPSAIKLETEICLLLAVMIFAINLFQKIIFKLLAPVITLILIIYLYKINTGQTKKFNKQPILWQVKIDAISMDYALSKSLNWLKENNSKFRFCVTLNALGINLARKNKTFRETINHADLILPDGAGLVLALKLLNFSISQRVAGIDFMERLCELAAIEKLPIALLGSKPEIVKKASENLKTKYKGLKIVFTHHGYFDKNNSDKIAKNIKSSGAKILFVALGVPEQELLIFNQRKNLENILAVGVGGSFDVISGKLKRAPKLLQKLGFEWIYRLILEPRKRFKQDLGLLQFLFYVLLEKFNIFKKNEE